MGVRPSLYQAGLAVLSVVAAGCAALPSTTGTRAALSMVPKDQPLTVPGAPSQAAAAEADPTADLPKIPGVTFMAGDARQYISSSRVLARSIRSWVLRAGGVSTGGYEYGSHTICSGISGYSAPVKTVDYIAQNGTREIIILNHPIQPNYPQYFYWKIPCSSNAYHGWYWYGLGPTIYQPYLDPNDVLTWFKNGLKTRNWSPAPPPAGYSYPEPVVTSTIASYFGEGTFTLQGSDKVAYQVPATKALLINYFTGKLSVNGVAVEFRTDSHVRSNFFMVFGASETVLFQPTGIVNGYTLDPEILQRPREFLPSPKYRLVAK